MNVISWEIYKTNVRLRITYYSEGLKQIYLVTFTFMKKEVLYLQYIYM